MRNAVYYPLIFLLLPMLANSQESDSLEVETYGIYLEAMDYMVAFQFDKALETLSTCYIREPENIDYLNKIAYCHDQLGRYRDAKLYYNKILKLDTANTIALNSIGGIYEKERNYVKAKDFYNELITVDSTNSYYFKKIGYLSLKLEEVIPAAKFFLKALQFNDKDLEVIDVLSSIYLSLGELDAAEGLLRKGLGLDGLNIKLLQNQARLMQKRKRHQEVIKAIEKTMEQGDTNNYYQMMLGVAYLKVDSLDKSITNLMAIVKRKKDSEHTHHYLGLAYLGKEDYKKSITHLNKAIDLGISEKMGTYYGDLANVHEKNKDYKKALNHYEQAYAYTNEPDHLFFMARSADFYFRDKRIAQKYYQRYLSKNHKKYKSYTEDRLKQLKEIIHFQVK